MGWLRTLFLGDIGNRLDIADNEDRIRRMQSEWRDKSRTDRTQDLALDELRSRCEQLELALASVMRLLAEHGAVPRDELEGVARVIEGDPDRA